MRPSDPKSQVETTKKIRDVVKDLESKIIAPEDLVRLRTLVFKKIRTIPYSKQSAAHEKSIRWKRTADEILRDGYVYQGKSCTDLVVSFIALCKALKINARFVKVKNENLVHSLAEVKLGKDWYIFDVSNPKSIPEKGELKSGTEWGGWSLWRKGRDAWDLGLVEFESIEQIKN